MASCEEWLYGCHLPRKPQVIAQVSTVCSATVVSTQFWSTCSSLVHAPFRNQRVFQCCFWLTALGQYQRKPKRIRAFCSSGELGELQKHLIQQDQYLQDLPYTAQLTSGCRYSVKCSSEASSCSGFYLHHINICLGPQQEILSEEELLPSPVAHLHLPMWYKAGRILDPSRRR